jgi:glyoxylase-like metal-dependent hydrolase (beta-lactamase superfamily II)
MDAGMVANIAETELRPLLLQSGIEGNKMPSIVNVYLVNTGKHLVLVDAGYGTLAGAQMGRTVASLRASGYTPEQVDTVLLTHMHPDHIAGLLDADGKMLFPNAKVYVNQQESEFWLSEKEAAKASAERMKKAFKVAQSSSAPYRMAGKWQVFRHRDEVVPGITAISAGGHTPGHTIFRVKSEDHRFFILGDTVLAYAVQFARPDTTLEFDVSPQQAVLTRYKVFNLAAKYRWLVAGSHLPWPGIGRIRSSGEGAYTWIPAPVIPE